MHDWLCMAAGGMIAGGLYLIAWGLWPLRERNPGRRLPPGQPAKTRVRPVNQATADTQPISLETEKRK